MPFLRLEILSSIPLDIEPIREEKINKPAIVISNIKSRKPQPSSPVTVPASSTLIKLCQIPSTKSKGSFSIGLALSPKIKRKNPAIITNKKVTNANQEIIAIGPFERVLSKLYLNFSLKLAFVIII